MQELQKNDVTQNYGPKFYYSLWYIIIQPSLISLHFASNEFTFHFLLVKKNKTKNNSRDEPV